MARRILEKEKLANEGLALPTFGKGQVVNVSKELKGLKSFNGLYSLQFNYTGDILAVGYGSGGIQVFDANTGEKMRDLRQCRQGGSNIMALHFHPKESHILYAATTEGHIYVFNVDTGELLQTIEEPGNEIFSLDFSVDGYNFATGGKDLAVRIYETKGNKLVKTFPGISAKSHEHDRERVGTTMRVFAIKFHPNNEYIFISGGWDNHIKIWDVRDNEGVVRNINGPHICGDALDMKGNEILCGQWTALHALQEYNYTSGKVTREIKYPNKDGAFLYAAHYCNDDVVFAGGSGTEKAEVIEVSTNREIGSFQLPGPIHCLDSARDGRILAVGGASEKFVILNMQDDKECQQKK